MYADLFARLKVLMHNTESTQCQPDSRLRGQNAVDFVPEGFEKLQKKILILICACTSLCTYYTLRKVVLRSGTLFGGNEGVNIKYGGLACLHPEQATLKVFKANKTYTT